MTQMTSGQNVPLRNMPVTITLAVGDVAQLDIDVSAYLLTEAGKVRGDADMIFYGQPESPDGAVCLKTIGNQRQVDINAMPNGIEKIAITVVADDLAGQGRALDAAGTLSLAVSSGGETVHFTPALSGEKALILGEIYRRNGEIKFRAIGQGFEGGLKPLAEHYGITVADPVPASEPAPAPAQPTIDLRKKRLIDLEKKDPKLVSLAKKATISLEKKGVDQQRAKVALLLDISGSMAGLFKSGAIDRLVQRILALGLSMDDDGDIDVFLFGRHAHDYGSVNANSYQTFVTDMQRKHSLEYATMYGEAMKMVRRHYQGQPDWGDLPVYVMFVTDGGTQDVRVSETQIKEASGEPIFWQFMAIGDMPKPSFAKQRNQRTLPRGFDFLKHLDDMPGRVVDNANFFAVSNPDDPSDEELYDLLMEEYPDWLRQVREKDILK